MTDTWYYSLCIVGGALVGHLTKNSPIVVTVLADALMCLMLAIIYIRSKR